MKNHTTNRLQKRPDFTQVYKPSWRLTPTDPKRLPSGQLPSRLEPKALVGTAGDTRSESLRLYCASAESLRNLTSFPGARPEGCMGMIDYCQGVVPKGPSTRVWDEGTLFHIVVGAVSIAVRSFILRASRMCLSRWWAGCWRFCGFIFRMSFILLDGCNTSDFFFRSFCIDFIVALWTKHKSSNFFDDDLNRYWNETHYIEIIPIKKSWIFPVAVFNIKIQTGHDNQKKINDNTKQTTKHFLIKIRLFFRRNQHARRVWRMRSVNFKKSPFFCTFFQCTREGEDFPKARSHQRNSYIRLWRHPSLALTLARFLTRVPIFLPTQTERNQRKCGRA